VRPGPGGLDDNLAVGAIAGGVGGLVGELVERAKIAGYFGEGMCQIDCVKVEGLAPGLGGEVIEGAHALSVDLGRYVDLMVAWKETLFRCNAAERWWNQTYPVSWSGCT
jgi:hypothetical protein